jgi:dihydrofolate reductase
VTLTQYYTATTLDGFIADPDNSLEWLFTRKRDEDGPMNYGEFIAGVGAIAMGSTTYEWILDHEFADKDPADWKWPYDIPCWVFTHRELPIVPDAAIEFTAADVAAVHEEMVSAAGERNVWIVGGGDLAGQFADAGIARRGHRVDRGDAWCGRATAAPPDRAESGRGRARRRLRVRKVLRRAPTGLRFRSSREFAL